MNRPDETTEARRSYDLRHRRVMQSKEQLQLAKAELRQIFEAAFKHPDAAASQFVSLVSRYGLRRAAAKMQSAHTTPAPAWRALQGSIHPFSGISRERERASEYLAGLAEAYRKAEKAQFRYQTAEDLLADADKRLQKLLAGAPAVEHAPQHLQRQKRRLRQRL